MIIEQHGAATARVRAAIRRTKELHPEYWDNMLRRRSARSITAKGAVYELSPQAVEHALLGAVWMPYAHPDVEIECTAFYAPIAGLQGVVDLRFVPEYTPVTLVSTMHTSFVEATISCRKERVCASCLIVGNNSELVQTFHPGSPTRTSAVPGDPNTWLNTTAGDAVERKLYWARVIS